MNTVHKAQLLQKRRWRIRKKVTGTAARPRLSVKFSAKHIYAQAINDDAGATLVFLSSLDPELRKQKLSANLAGAKVLGVAFASRRRRPGSPRSSSTAAAPVITARSRSSPTPPARAALYSNQSP
jgi:large subunit ribosomal protein L18